MQDANYISVYGWMINKLKLSGNDLLCYALIYGFYQDGKGELTGSLRYVSECLNISRDRARVILNKLTESNLIIKRDEILNGVKFCRYAANPKMIVSITDGVRETSTPSAKQVRGVRETSIGGVRETSNNNIDDNNIIYNKREKEKIRLPSKSGVLDLDLESCKSVLMENQSWKETVVMNLQSGGFPMFAMEDLETNLDFFFKKLANEGVTEKSPKDAMAHFSRWLNIELKNANQKHNTTKQEANDYAMQQFIKYCQSTDDSWTPGPDKPF